MFDNRSAAHLFSHPNNIQTGLGRVLYAQAATDISGVSHPEGWVLPGGQRTQSAVVAQAVAASINDILIASGA